MSDTTLNPGGTDRAAGTNVPTLADILKDRGALPEPELLGIFVSVLEGLESAHSQGTFHRDISPARIVLVGGTWKLTDYGVSKVGSVRYMSPERCQGKPMDARSDIYSLGIVLFEAATGRVPFDADMKFQVMEAQVGTPPPAPRTLKPTISAELEQVILKALTKNPAGRHQTAAELRQALTALGGRSVPSAGMPPRPAPPGRKASPQASKTSAAGGTEARRLKPTVFLLPAAAVVLVVVVLLLTGVLGGKKVPAVTGMGLEQAQQLLSSKGIQFETESVDDTLPVGTVVSQTPPVGTRASRSLKVVLRTSSGMVAVPVLAGLPLADARARLADLSLATGRLDSTYNDDYAAGVVVSSGQKAGVKLAPHSTVSLVFSAGRATCPQCRARREPGAKFCTKCGYKL